MSGNITTGKGWLTVPVLFFHEAEGLTISVEVKDGTLYRGRAERTEDNFSVSLSDATATSPTGEVTTLQRVYIRGNRIVFVVFPDVLERAPIFDRVRRTSEGKVVAGGLGAARQMAIQNKRAFACAARAIFSAAPLCCSRVALTPQRPLPTPPTPRSGAANGL
jgi:small nuclear ribonucleoprotein D3